MAEFIARWFTPSDSDQSGMVGSGPARKPQVSPAQAGGAKAKKKKTQTKYAGQESRLNMFTDEAEIAKKTLLGQ
uniref:Uncharacterized protein n=1 Tax=viral metagenome TaxID=1070528 RepID=A0A6M3L289_9ZZZZ